MSPPMLRRTMCSYNRTRAAAGWTWRNGSWRCACVCVCARPCVFAVFAVFAVFVPSLLCVRVCACVCPCAGAVQDMVADGVPPNPGTFVALFNVVKDAADPLAIPSAKAKLEAVGRPTRVVVP